MAVVSGGTTLIDNGALDAGVPKGSLILLSTQTASASANISFTSDIDSTYDSYVFKFINIHPASDGVQFLMQGSTNSGSSYGVTTTDTNFAAFQRENGTGAALSYFTAYDVAQSTSFFPLHSDFLDNDNDSSCSGSLHLFNPSSTTYVKLFITRNQAVCSSSPNYTFNSFTAGYFNTTSAINAIQFKYSSGNIDDGIIKMYGVV
jgi:hypothetical protein